MKLEFDHSRSGIPIYCYHCKAHGIHVRWTVRWANQYGEGIRVFCHSCGWATDAEREYEGGVTTIKALDWTAPEKRALPWQPQYKIRRKHRD